MSWSAFTEACVAQKLETERLARIAAKAKVS